MIQCSASPGLRTEEPKPTWLEMGLRVPRGAAHAAGLEDCRGLALWVMPGRAGKRSEQHKEQCGKSRKTGFGSTERPGHGGRNHFTNNLGARQALSWARGSCLWEPPCHDNLVTSD